MKIASRDIETVLALKFDVDITPAAVNLILPEAQEFGWTYDKKYHRDKQAQDRYFKNCGIEEETYIEVGDRRENAIIMFLMPLIGQPCRLPFDLHQNDDVKFIPSEYFQKHGNVLDVDNLPDRKWKSFADIPQPPPRANSGKKQKNILVEPSENLLTLNRLLLEANCPETTVAKYQLQLRVIAGSGLDLNRLEIATNGEQILFSASANGKTFAVDLLPARCAIRLHGKKVNDKIYARTEKDVARTLDWLLK